MLPSFVNRTRAEIRIRLWGKPSFLYNSTIHRTLPTASQPSGMVDRGGFVGRLIGGGPTPQLVQSLQDIRFEETDLLVVTEANSICGGTASAIKSLIVVPQLGHGISLSEI